MKAIHILMIGAGRMAEAIISGLKQNEKTINITVTNLTDQGRLHVLAERYKVNSANDWRDVVSRADVIISAAPPSAHEKLMADLAPLINGQLFITVAAGVDTTFMEERLPEGTPVCWIMPNTAASVQASISTYVCGRFITNDQRKMIEMILTSIGEYEELTEEQVHDLTAITGSAPAFLYSFCEALEEAAVSYGINREQAQKLVVKMVTGSAAMLDGGTPASELREQVTTPGGSTAAGLNVLEVGGFKRLLIDAVKGTNEHARGRSN